MRKRNYKCRSKQPPASGRQPSHKLTRSAVRRSAEELVAFHQRFAQVFSRREQREWSFVYLCGQLANLARKTIEPMALALLGTEAQAVRALQRHISRSEWAAKHMMEVAQQIVIDWLGDPNGVVIADGSGFPKQGKNSVGVARQYCGHLGKVANCQEGVFLIYASQLGYAFLDESLYLPESWFALEARDRWDRCGIPEKTLFRTEPELALEMISHLVRPGQLPFRWLTADEHFGQNPGFLQGISQLGKWYMVEMPSDTRFWKRRPSIEPPGQGLLGRPRLYRRVSQRAPAPQMIRDIATQLKPGEWTRQLIKEGSKGPMLADFAFLRLIPVEEKLPGPISWVIIRRAVRTPHEEKYYLSNAPASCASSTFVWLSGMRWPIETVFEEAKGEVGMDHYETRTWVGWHHHMAQTFIAHLCLIGLRRLFKKKPSAHHGPSPRIDCTSDHRRLLGRTRCHFNHLLSPTAQLHCVSLASQTRP